VTPDEILRLLEEHVPFNRLLGLKGEWVEVGRAVLTLPVRQDFVGDPRRPALHGGVLSTLIDTAGGLAAWSALAPGESVSTVDLRVDYLEPAGLGAPLRAEAELVRKGNRVCHVRVAVTQDGLLVADIFGDRQFERWRDGEDELHLLLDSFDQAKARIPNLGALLASRLRRYPVDRLQLMIACRSADWPESLEVELRDIFDGEVGVYELLPLQRADVRVLAEQAGIDGQAFLDEVERSGELVRGVLHRCAIA